MDYFSELINEVVLAKLLNWRNGSDSMHIKMLFSHKKQILHPNELFMLIEIGLVVDT